MLRTDRDKKFSSAVYFFNNGLQLINKAVFDKKYYIPKWDVKYQKFNLHTSKQW